MSSDSTRDTASPASPSGTLPDDSGDASPSEPTGTAQLELVGAPAARSGEISSSMSADAALAALNEASALVDAVGEAARAMTEGVSSASSEAAVISAAVVAAVQTQVPSGAVPVGQAEEAVDGGVGEEGDDFDDWDEEDELGWAIGSELEFLDDESDDWDGPVGDGLDEEEGLGGIAISKDPAADKAAIDAAANSGEDEEDVEPA